jgi:hypothetical protein
MNSASTRPLALCSQSSRAGQRLAFETDRAGGRAVGTAGTDGEWLFMRGVSSTGVLLLDAVPVAGDGHLLPPRHLHA